MLWSVHTCFSSFSSTDSQSTPTITDGLLQHSVGELGAIFDWGLLRRLETNSHHLMRLNANIKLTDQERSESKDLKSLGS